MTKHKPSNGHGGARPGAGPKVSILRLSMPESMLIIDALNGNYIEPALAEQLIWQEVQEAIALNRLDTKWNVEAAPLVATLRKLSHATALELLEQVKVFWDGQAARES